MIPHAWHGTLIALATPVQGTTPMMTGRAVPDEITGGTAAIQSRAPITERRGDMDITQRQEIIDETAGVTYPSVYAAAKALNVKSTSTIANSILKKKPVNGHQLSFGRRYDFKKGEYVRIPGARTDCIFYDKAKKRCNALTKTFCIFEKCVFYKTKN